MPVSRFRVVTYTFPFEPSVIAPGVRSFAQLQSIDAKGATLPLLPGAKIRTAALEDWGGPAAPLETNNLPLESTAIPSGADSKVAGPEITRAGATLPLLPGEYTVMLSGFSSWP